MTHAEMGEVYELYVLGLLDPEETAEMDAHIASHCPQCEAGVKAARAMTGLLGLATSGPAPPKSLRRRVLASVGVEPRSLWLSIALLGACAAALSIALLLTRTESAALQAQLQASNLRLEHVRQALELLDEPETKQVVFGQAHPQPPRGRIFVNARRGVVLMASHLPPTPSGKTYEMWIVPKTGAPIPAGTFQSDAQGDALYVRAEPVDLGTTKAVAVTIEREGGATTPTMPLVIVAGVGD